VNLETEKATLQEDLSRLEKELKEKTRRLDKLSKVQEALLTEPDKGTVLKFSRQLAGSSLTYTFVAFRASGLRSGWYFTGRANALRLLGVTEKGNNWGDVLVAIGDAKVEIATQWTTPGEESYSYFKAFASGKLIRVPDSDQHVVEVHDGPVRGWRRNRMMDKGYLLRNPGSYKAISASEATV
jgi:hypothetical protein